MIKVKVFAKVNLSLEINGIENGFHMLDSVVASADIVDVISLAKSETDKVEITPCYDSVKEKIYSLISFMRAKYEFECVNINIEKNIPLGGGLGGSSAPIAGVIRGIDQLFSLNLSRALSNSLTSSLSPVQVTPIIGTTQIVFSSHILKASSASSVVFSRVRGTVRISICHN